jgi:hypothetical protein
MPVMVVGKKNVEAAATILKGMAVKFDTSADDGVLKCTTTADAVVGIAMEDIAAGKWGNIQTAGLAVCLAGGNVTKGDLVGPDAASKVATIATDKKTSIGRANRTAATDELFEVVLGLGAQTSL